MYLGCMYALDEWLVLHTLLFVKNRGVGGLA